MFEIFMLSVVNKLAGIELIMVGSVVPNSKLLTVEELFEEAIYFWINIKFGLMKKKYFFFRLTWVARKVLREGDIFDRSILPIRITKFAGLVFIIHDNGTALAIDAILFKLLN